MILGVFGGAALLVALAVLYGRALSAIGVSSWGAGPAVGFAVELVAANIGCELPGLATTAAIILLVLAIVSIGVCVWRGDRPRCDAVPWIVLAIGVFGAALPFLANGRVGLLGVSLDNDTAAHLVYAAALTSSTIAHLLPAPPYYPLAPHALAAALQNGVGIRLDAGFDAFPIATMLITALVGSAALRAEAWWRRVLAGTVVAFLYLASGYYGEDSFKELILGMLLLGFVVDLEGVRSTWGQTEGARWPLLIAPALLFVAGLYNYGYLAALWFVLTVVLWLLAEAVSAPRRIRGWSARWREFIVPTAIAVVAAIVLLLPITSRLLSLFAGLGIAPEHEITTSNVGNLPGPLSPYSALGIWQSFDFRRLPLNAFHAGEWGAFALLVIAFGLARAILRRQYVLAAAVIACLLVYLESSHSQSIYVTAKSLAIASPIIGLTASRALLATDGTALSARGEWVRRLVAAVYIVFALYSSSLVLRSEPVWPMTGPNELLSFANMTKGESTLVLDDSEYTGWIFDRSPIPPIGDQAPAAKPIVSGAPIDWDNETAQRLNQYRWVVTSNTPDASQPPAGFRLVRRLSMFELWKRVGTVAPFTSIDAPGQPGAVLNCSDRVDRRISRLPGIAAVMRAPIATPATVLLPNWTGEERIPLPPGRWELSMQDFNGVAVRVSEEGVPGQWTVPAYLDGLGPLFAFGSVRSYGGALILRLHAEKPSFFTSGGAFLQANIGTIVATPIPYTRTIVPLRDACGRYVDWYRVSGH